MNTSAYRMSFWLVAHTIYESSLISAIREEIDPGIKGGKSDINYHSRRSKLPNAQRYTSAAASSRDVDSARNFKAPLL